MTKPRLIHITTTDMSLDWLLGPQLEAFVAAGFEVMGASAAGSHVEAIEARGIRHIALAHATRAMAPGEDVLALRELYEVFRRERPTIVHTHNPKPGLYGRLAARAARVPVVVNTTHGLYALPDDPLPKRAVVYGLERIAFPKCSDAELLQNPEDLPVLERLGVPRRKLHVLGNGIDLTRFERSALDEAAVTQARADFGVEPDAVVIGAVGRLVREKGYFELFEAVRRARVSCPALRLVVVGPSEPEKADAMSADEIARAEQSGVVFLGHREDVDVLYGAMDAYVLASHREGFPRSAMEAAAMGLPIVATNIRGCRQVVDHGTTGLLVPLGDIDRMADALALIAGDPDRRRTMSAAAKVKARREFDQQRVIDLTLAVYRERLAAADV